MIDLDKIVNNSSNKIDKVMISKKEKTDYIKKAGRPEKMGEKRDIILKCLLTKSESDKMIDYCYQNKITKSELIVNFIKGL